MNSKVSTLLLASFSLGVYALSASPLFAEVRAPRDELSKEQQNVIEDPSKRARLSARLPQSETEGKAEELNDEVRDESLFAELGGEDEEDDPEPKQVRRSFSGGSASSQQLTIAR